MSIHFNVHIRTPSLFCWVSVCLMVWPLLWFNLSYSAFIILIHIVPSLYNKLILIKKWRVKKKWFITNRWLIVVSKRGNSNLSQKDGLHKMQTQANCLSRPLVGHLDLLKLSLLQSNRVIFQDNERSNFKK